MANNFLKIKNGLSFGAQSSAPANPVSGDIYYDSTQGTYVFYQDGFWINLASQVDVASATALTSSALTAPVVQNSLIRITGTISSSLDGLAASSQGKQVVVYNDTNTVITVQNQSVTEPTAANRIFTPSGASIVIKSGQTIVLIYDATQVGWIAASSPGGSGSGSGTGDDLDALQYNASFTDLLSDPPTSPVSSINISSGFTNAGYSGADQSFIISYDASKTVTGTGTAMTLSATPSYTVIAGDVLRVGTQARKIVTVNTQTSYILESAFTVDPSTAACCVSQAVYTKDLNNFAADGISIGSVYTDNIYSTLVTYNDTTSGAIYNNVDPALVAYVASANGTNYSNVSAREANLSHETFLTPVPVGGTSLYLRFFSNASSGSGTSELVGYKAFFHRTTAVESGDIQNQAICFSNSVGTPVGCSNPSVVSGKTTIMLDWSYPVGLSPGAANGSLEVFVNGQKLPRYINATLTPDGSYTEVSANTIALDSDYSGINFLIEIFQIVSVVDSNTQNTTSVASLQAIQAQGFQPFVDTSHLLQSTTTVGTPGLGLFYSTIPNRSAIVDPTQDLRVVGPSERILINYAERQNVEAGPNGELVWASNDRQNRVRFVGSGWFNTQAENSNAGGYAVQTDSLNDYVEISFYGTGLNLLSYTNSGGTDLEWSLDGGSETPIANTSTNSNALGGILIAVNIVYPVVSGLPLGIHTVKIRLNTGSFLFVYGFEALNESANVAVSAGAGYLNGNKYYNASEDSFAYSTPVSGTTGGRVAVYQNSDGSIAQGFTPCAVSPSYIGSVNHSSEEIYRVYNWREFGSGGAAAAFDFLSLPPSTSPVPVAYTSDDGTSSLFANACTGVSSISGFYIPTSDNGYYAFTFVGTGLDIMHVENSNVDTYFAAVDSVSAGSFPSSNGVMTTTKICSGLPYGTHNVTISMGGGVTADEFHPFNFIVYQPKTPTIPSSSLLLGAYNVLANYISPTGGVNGFQTVPQGIIRKGAIREFNYNGANWVSLSEVNSSNSTTAIEGLIVKNDSPSTSNFITYTFYGTGFNFRSLASTSDNVIAFTANGLTLDTTNYPSMVANAFGPGSPSYSGNDFHMGTSNVSVGVSISSLPLDLYTVTFTFVSGVNFYFEGLDLIVPIYGPKENLIGTFGNSATIGSNSITDERNFTPVIESSSAKAWSKVEGNESSPSTTASNFVPIPDMTTQVTTDGGDLKMSYSISSYMNTSGQPAAFSLLIDGELQAIENRYYSPGSNLVVTTSNVYRIPVAPGIHTVSMVWAVGSASTLTAYSTDRVLLVEEV